MFYAHTLIRALVTDEVSWTDHKNKKTNAFIIHKRLFFIACSFEFETEEGIVCKLPIRRS